jgi:hypothetical protein
MQAVFEKSRQAWAAFVKPFQKLLMCRPLPLVCDESGVMRLCRRVCGDIPAFDRLEKNV